MLKKKSKIRTLNGASQYIVRDVGMCLPEPFPIPELMPGQIGYLEAKVPANTFLTGQTLTENPTGKDIESYANFKLMKPSVFASFYPQTDKPFSGFRKVGIKSSIKSKRKYRKFFNCQFLSIKGSR